MVSSPLHPARRGFTLIELLVVIAIIAVLIGLLIPAVQQVRETAFRATCGNNLHQIGVAAQNYHNANEVFPPLRIAGGDGWATFFVLILPYMEEGNLYSAWDITQKYAAQSVVARQTSVPAYFCPSRRTAGGLSVAEDFDVNDATPPPTVALTTTVQPRFSVANNPPGALGDYAVCVGDMRGTPNNPNSQTWFSVNANGAIILATSTIPSNQIITTFTSNTRINTITDGTNHTILAGEKHVPRGMFGRLKVGDGPLYSGAWSAYCGRLGGIEDPLARSATDLTPSAGAVDGIYARKFGSWHPGICQFVMCDGSTRAIRNNIDTANLRRLASRNDTEVITYAD